MAKTTIEQLAEFGQSAWLDNISRSLIESGKLRHMIDLGLRGVTSNPTIFEKAIAASRDYDERIFQLHQKGLSAFEIYDCLTVADVQDAADIFLPVYEKTRGVDGYVSLEINPKLARLTKETIVEGRRLHKKVNRVNVMLKVPATDEGFPAMEELLAEGIPVNATLIFSLDQYAKTARAYLKGSVRLLENKGNVEKVCSVASVFVSRIDTVADAKIDKLLDNENDEKAKNELRSLKGRAAVANSSLIFQKYAEIFAGRGEFSALKEKGARIQRLLWGSTSTKNPAYSNIKYVSELIARNTINTMPQPTFEEFLKSGTIGEALTPDARGARDTDSQLKGFGIDTNDICRGLLEDGVRIFENSFDTLLASIENKVKVSSSCILR